MARLIVEAVSAEHKSGDLGSHVQLYVSVSRPEDGSSVTGLDKSNFRVTAPGGLLLRLRVTLAQEHKWETNDSQLSGCYLIAIDRYNESDLSQPLPIIRGEWYTFGVQVRIFDPRDARVVVDQGQTVVHIQSLGE
jgi:hypothetical protein